MKGRTDRRKVWILFIFTIILIHLNFPLIHADNQVSFSFDPRPNDAPYAAFNPDPSNCSIGNTIPVTLFVDVYDETGYVVDVYFYDAKDIYNSSDDILIGIDYNVSCDLSTASILWNDLIEGEIYYWYTIVKDSQYENKSETWVFATGPNQPPTILNEYPVNNSKNSNLQPLCHVDVFDNDGDNLTIYWYENSTGSWILRRTEYNVKANSTVYWAFMNATKYSTTYYWMVTVTDSIYYTSSIFNFTTKPQPSGGGSESPSGGYVPPPNQLPVAIITAPDSAYVNETLILYAYYSYDPDGYLTGYRWDFDNDGVFDTNWTEDTFVIYNYSKPGIYTIKLQIQDNSGAIANTTHDIEIIQIRPDMMPPVPIINCPYFGYTNENIMFNSDSSYDPDGEIINYTWYFDDGNVSYLENPVHTYYEEGNYSVILKITDNDNLSNVTIIKVTILDKEVKEKEKEKELPFLFLFIIVTSIIATIVLFIMRSKKLQLTVIIDETDNQKENINKNESIDQKIDDLLSDYDKNSNKK